jgi:succinate dehydrogenase / fumarate reductase iron-sulfur subunit
MADKISKKRVFKIFRYDPSSAMDGHFDRFELEIEDENLTTILDVLLRIQREHDPSLAFRYSCRISMCGSCGMVINGKEALACQTVVANLTGKEITIRPLNHFPVVRDLVVDMDPFFENYEKALTYFQAAQEMDEPAIIRPDSKERKIISDSTECIACGCCVSACTMAHWHKDYLGPGALNRAFTLLADSRDGLHKERLVKVLEACYNCRTEFNCTEVCPKGISPTRAIKYIQMLAAKEAFQREPRLLDVEKAPLLKDYSETDEQITRRRFLSNATLGLAGMTALFMGGLLTATGFVPSMRERPRKWVHVGRVEDFPPGSIKTVNIHYKARDGFYESLVEKPVLVSCKAGTDNITVFNSRCTHLGCTVNWDEKKNLFICPCHMGTFYPDGRVKSGPPPRPLDRYPIKLKSGDLFVEEA